MSPAATPFAGWTFHRAWWDAYADTARERYLIVTGEPAASASTADRGSEAIRAIVPLMLRDAPGPSSVLFMAATYHADYATILAHPDDLPGVVHSVVGEILPRAADRAADASWNKVDLRRFRADDPALRHLHEALEMASTTLGWRFRKESEDVCPVVSLAGDWETQLGTLSKKVRHEVRRKLRRAERSGPVTLRYLPLSSASVDHFIRVHQARWGKDGLFSASDEDGERSRTFLRRLVELEAAEGEDARFHIADVRVAERAVYVLAGFDDGVTTYFYNAGMEPDALALSPGVIGTAVYMRDRLAAGRTRFDLLRGDEAYKYEWGAVDEPIYRLVLSRVP